MKVIFAMFYVKKKKYIGIIASYCIDLERQNLCRHLMSQIVKA